MYQTFNWSFMPRKDKGTRSALLAGLRETVNKIAVPAENRKIPTILEFVDEAEYLGLPLSPTNPIILYPMQRLILKAFYRGSEGNEHLAFDQDELDYLRACGLDKADPAYSERGDVVGKLSNNTVFRELVLVWGRRSGKDFIVSIIALYEAMKLLETPGGDPYRKYNIARGGNPITILTVATAAPQAALAFNEMKSKLLQSKYFRNKFIAEGLGASSIHLQTPADRIDNENRKKRGLPQEKGGIVIRSGHSNSDGLLGIQCFVLLMDEVASFKQTDGASGGRRVYEAMLPSLNTFVRDERDSAGNLLLDEEQKPIKVYDSKVISISSPRGREGILHDMFKEADTQADRLVCRMPTWIVNTRYTKESLRKTFSQFDDQSFMMEFGAEFSPTAGMNFFVAERVKACMDYVRPLVNRGQHGAMYFAHLDPATSSNNYTLAIVHKEFRVNPQNSKVEQLVVLDHLKVWSPIFNEKTIVPVNMNDVDVHMVYINRNFHLGLVTYDDFQSLTTLQMMRKIGMPSKLTRYSKPYKMQIYTELEKLVNERRLVLPFDGGRECQLLENELLSLQRRFDSGRGFSIMPNPECDVKTDDCCDALAGAVFSCLNTAQSKLPTSRLANVPVAPLSSGRTWMSMQGVPYGFGSGPQVASKMRGSSPQTGFGFGF
jgi:hypothetical protein